MEKCINDPSRSEICCSKCYEDLKDEPCDKHHYCTFVNWDEYAKVQLGGFVCFLICSAVSVSSLLVSVSLPVFPPLLSPSLCRLYTNFLSCMQRSVILLCLDCNHVMILLVCLRGMRQA